MNLIINDSFKNLLRPLSDNELSGLEESLLNEGCREAIITWNGVIVDGHNRYSICVKNNIPFNTLEMEFKDENAVKLWMIDNQIGKRNIVDFERVELILMKKPFLAEIAKQRQIEAVKRGNVSRHEDSSDSGCLTAEDLNNRPPPRGLPVPANLPELAKEDKGEVRAQIAKEAGKSGRTVSSVEQVLKSGTEDLKRSARVGDISISAASQKIENPSIGY